MHLIQVFCLRCNSELVTHQCLPTHHTGGCGWVSALNHRPSRPVTTQILTVDLVSQLSLQIDVAASWNLANGMWAEGMHVFQICP